MTTTLYSGTYYHVISFLILYCTLLHHLHAWNARGMVIMAHKYLMAARCAAALGCYLLTLKPGM
jgi:hypothetical protein